MLDAERLAREAAEARRSARPLPPFAPSRRCTANSPATRRPTAARLQQAAHEAEELSHVALHAELADVHAETAAHEDWAHAGLPEIDARIAALAIQLKWDSTQVPARAPRCP
jgi:hypothetical protein